MNPSIAQLLENNRNWASSREAREPGIFETQSKGQSPEFLWIGCADSRIPPNTITGLQPGELFVHRNVANLVAPNDPNLLSVLHYSVLALKVKHVILCGHYGCGGIQHAINGQPFGVVDEWVQPVRELLSENFQTLAPLPNEAQFDRLCELNVVRQVKNLRQTDTVKQAWEAGQSLAIHAWIYQLESGHIKVLQDPVTGP
jgi:carbonic anhydrase